MITEELKKKPDIVEMAKKLRHVKIVEKLHKRQPPTQSEIKELAHYEAGDAPPGVVDTQAQVARVFGKSLRQVERWFQEDDAPIRKDGRYSIDDIRVWYDSRGTNKKRNKKKDDGSTDWEEEYRKYKALREKRKDALEAGSVVLRSEVESGLIQASIAVKRALLTLPKVLAPILQGKDPREIEEISREKVETIIEMFSKEKIFTKKEDNAGDDRKAKHLDRKRK